jgi:cell division protease FtsH
MKPASQTDLDTEELDEVVIPEKAVVSATDESIGFVTSNMLTKANFPAWVEAHRESVEFIADESIVPIGTTLKEIHSVIERLKRPELLLAAGGDLPRGLVFSGAPGTGKTLTARYLASRLDVGVRVYEFGGDELEAAMIRPLFDYLADSGEQTLLVIDEMEIFALMRNDPNHTESTRRTLFAVLATLEGFRAFPNVIVVGTTNEECYNLDAALLRPGRLGFRIIFATPSPEERENLFKLFAVRRQFAGTPDWQRCAQLTSNWTPADIRQALDDALGLALSDKRERPNQIDIEAAIRRNGNASTENTIVYPELKHQIALHEAGHTAALVNFFGRSSVSSVRCDAFDGGGYTVFEAEHARQIQTVDGVYKFIQVSFAGVLTERALGLSQSLGGEDDLTKAGRHIFRLLNSGLIDGPLLGINDFDYRNEVFSRILFDETVKLTQQLWGQAAQFIESHQEGIVSLGERLLAANVLAGDELTAALTEAGLINAELEAKLAAVAALDAPAGASDED